MSHGNDAFTPKDAATSASTEASLEDSAKSDSAKSDSAKSDEGSADRDSGQDAKSQQESVRDPEDRDQEDRGKAQPSTGSRRASSKTSRKSSRDDEDDDERLVPPQTEEEIDVPKKYTIYMLAAMSTLTVILWFMAKLSCNMHPDQVREPKHFSTKDLAADPKNAAFEFHHRFETGDFTTAFDLSTGEMKRIVEGKLKECEQNADDCAKNQKKLADTIESTGKVLERTDNRASVELSSIYKNAPGTKSFAFDVVKEGDFWRVASRHEVATAPVQQAQPPAAAPSAPAAAVPGQAPVELSDQTSSSGQ